ncbi:MAG: DNA internalization-related competence protein ComEC/Rec2, partial [Proteobacteria bacterium]|nr:DNA internalization-related competence protein ComEC/Rec2 [Pseudomonadota bacterium]
TLWTFERGWQARLDHSLSGKVMDVSGVISSIPEVYPDYARFRFDPLPDDDQQELPGSLLVYWYRDFPLLSVGENWRLGLQLKPPWGRVNFQGGDRERWLFSEKIGGLGTVRHGEFLSSRALNQYYFQSARSFVRKKISLLLDNERTRGVVQALAIADRSGMSFKDRQLLSSTGTSHLLAISGLHVGLAAVGGAWLARIAMILLPVTVAARWGLGASLAGALFAALTYATLAGWGVSTQRAVLMLTVAVLALAFNRAVHPARAWVLALAVVLAVDPLAPLSSGSWFSFLAVAVLLIMFVPRNGRISWWKTAMLAQAGIMVTMLPVTVLWFQSFSPVGFLANLGAIPWVSLVVVPLTLAGVALLPVSMAVAGLLLKLAGEASAVLFLYLEFLAALQGPVPILSAPGILTVVLAMLGGMLLLLPAGFPVRWIGLFLILPLFLPPGPRTERGSLLIEVLDVGLGMAVLLSTEHHTLLYDSGPGDGREQNLVDAVITPALAGLGRHAPEQIIISHGDLDHAGGLATLLKHYPTAELFANLPAQPANIEPCHSDLAWSHDGFEFQVLHPSMALPYLGNDSSCVLSVRGPQASVLFTGDITSAIENRLRNTMLAPHDILFVPHHGSKTSSATEFIAAVRPEASIATASLGNRFGFPRDEIRQRYIDAGSKFWSTGECGAVRILITADGEFHAISARRKRNRIWRWPAGPECP